VACVDGALVASYDGLPYDTTRVQGTGAASDPYVLRGVEISLTDHAQYPAGILLVRCPHFHLEASRTYGQLARDPSCRGIDRLRDGEVADYAVYSVDSPGLRVTSSSLSYGRLAGLYAQGGDVEVLASDIAVNFGSGVHARQGALVNLTESYVAYNGWFMPETPPMRDGRVHPTWAAGLYVEEGAVLEVFNNTLYRNENAVNVDKSLNVSSDALLNYNTIMASDWAGVIVVGYEEENRMGWCSETGAPSWWANGAPPPSETPETPSGTTSRSASPLDPTDALYEGVPDAEADPVNVVDVRLNYWGRFNGPSAVEAQGKADYRFWLPSESPRASVAGLTRQTVGGVSPPLR
jgi:hypothetical protein